MGTRSGLATLLAAGILLAPVAGVAASPALADPTYPSADQVQEARDAAAAKAAEVARIQTRLTAANDRLGSAQVALGAAAEAYDGARIELARRAEAADLARAQASRATSALGTARAEVGQLAARSYMSGGDLAVLSAVLDSGGPQEMLDRTALVGDLARRQARTVQRLDTARLAASLTQEQAEEAVRRQEAAADTLAAARSGAESAARTAAATVRTVSARQAALTTQLAGLRHTSVELERQRQAGLEARRQAELRRKQEAERRRREQQRRSSNSSSGPSGGSSSGSSASSSSGSSSSSSSGSSSSGGSVPRSGAVAVAWAKRQLGLPYRWGGAGPNSYDCSGLTMRAWQRAGVRLPHYAASQYQLSTKVPYSAMRPGDLIFYARDTSRSSTIHHVTMFVGNGKMIEAPMTGLSVRIVPVRWNGTLAHAGRP